MTKTLKITFDGAGFRKAFAMQAVSVLNRALDEDPIAIREIFGESRRVSCVAALADDETIQAQSDGGGLMSVGVLGLINGIIGIRADGYGYIAAECDVCCDVHGDERTAPKKAGEICGIGGCRETLKLGKISRFLLTTDP